MIRAALFVAIASATAYAQPSGPTNENAKQHHTAGLAAYKAKDFATASKEFAAAFAAERYPGSLFAWAQSDRQRGECTSAVELYQRFLDETSPPESFAQLARDGIAACGGSTKPPPADPVPVMPAITADDKLEVPERPPPPKAEFPHKLSIILLSTGVALGGTSAYFYMSSRDAAKDADRAADHADVVRLYQLAEDRLLVSRITLGVGIGFAAASAIRFALTDSPPDDTVAIGVSPSGALFVAGAF